MCKLDSCDLLELISEHIRSMALQRGWQDLQIIDSQINQQGVTTVQVFEVNYEQQEAGQTEYFSAVIWYDITEPWGLIYAGQLHWSRNKKGQPKLPFSLINMD